MKSQSANRPHLLIPIGIPGAGKSYFAKQFSNTFYAPLISTEDISKTLSLPPANTKQNSVIQNVSDYILNEVLKTGRTVVYDGPAFTKSTRSALKKKANSFGYEPIFIWVQTDKTVAKKRLKKTYNNDVKLIESAIDKFQPPSATEKYIAISGQHTYSNQLKIILKALAGPVESADRPTRKPLIITR
ncbi:MAG: AAA family ATPase [Thiobacillus sp.]